MVAEHGHFGRAAEALHLAQPALSRQIRRLEHHVGATLFERDRLGTRLTDADVRTTHLEWNEPRAALVEHRSTSSSPACPPPLARLAAAHLTRSPDG